MVEWISPITHCFLEKQLGHSLQNDYTFDSLLSYFDRCCPYWSLAQQVALLGVLVASVQLGACYRWRERTAPHKVTGYRVQSESQGVRRSVPWGRGGCECGTSRRRLRSCGGAQRHSKTQGVWSSGGPASCPKSRPRWRIGRGRGARVGWCLCLCPFHCCYWCSCRTPAASSETTNMSYAFAGHSTGHTTVYTQFRVMKMGCIILLVNT